MYLRFQGQQPNFGTSSRLGILQLAGEFLDCQGCPAYAHDELQRNLSWLNKHLICPNILDSGEHFRAISWFRPAAHKPLERIWGIKAVLDEFGYFIELIKTNDPGQIIYKDGWQVVAKPWRKRNFV